MKTNNLYTLMLPLLLVLGGCAESQIKEVDLNEQVSSELPAATTETNTFDIDALISEAESELARTTEELARTTEELAQKTEEAKRITEEAEASTAIRKAAEKLTAADDNSTNTKSQDDQWDLGFGEELEAKNAKAAEATKRAEEATKKAEEATKRADILEEFVEIAKTPDVKVRDDGKLDMEALLEQARAKRDKSATELARENAETAQEKAETRDAMQINKALREAVETSAAPKK